MTTFFSTLPLLADAAATKQSPYSTFIMIGVALVFFYFLLWRPEQKRRKNLEKKRSSVKVGDRVTAMGLVGNVTDIKEKTVVLSMVEGAKIEVLTAAITEVHPKEEAQPAEASK